MGRKFKYTTLDRVLSKIYRDLGLEEIAEVDVVEWAGEALEAIDTVTLLEEAVAFIEVRDHQAELPMGLHTIIQLARNNKWEKHTDVLCPANVLLDCSNEEMENIESLNTPCGCGDEAIKYKVGTITDKYGNTISEDDIVKYKPYFTMEYNAFMWGDSHLYKEAYTPIRLANHSFFNSLVCKEDPDLYRSCNDEYSIVGDNITTSFKEGSIAISYYRQKIDEETGYPMIPDDYSVITAITMYITMKYMSRLWYMGREGYSDKFQKAELDWQWYCKQAKNKSFMLHGVDEFQNFTEERQALLHNRNKYYGFFGKLGRKSEMRIRNTQLKNNPYGRR